VTVADLAERLQGVRSVVVPPQAVVTPSARELLRSRNVSLAYGQAQGASPAHRVRLVLMATGSKSDPAALVRLLAGEQVEVRPEQSDCLIAATDRLAEALGDGNTLGALVTTYTAAGLCLANRHPGVRAVLGHDAASVGADAASVGANLLVVSPAPGLFRMKRIIVEFCREGPRRCPEVFRKRLG